MPDSSESATTAAGRPSSSALPPEGKRAAGGTRSPSGSNYGDYAPTPASTAHADADVGCAEREQRIREAAYRQYQRRGGDGGDALSDWLAAEAEVEQASRSPAAGRQENAGAYRAGAAQMNDADTTQKSGVP